MTNENPNQKNSRREAEIEFLSEFNEENSTFQDCIAFPLPNPITRQEG